MTELFEVVQCWRVGDDRVSMEWTEIGWRSDVAEASDKGRSIRIAKARGYESKYSLLPYINQHHNSLPLIPKLSSIA